MAIICPTITVDTIDKYRQQLQAINFAPRIHIDIADGEFASPKSVSPDQIYWEDYQLADVHVMVSDPYQHLETLLSKQPQLIILHAEANTFSEAFRELHQFNINIGIALLPETQPEQVADFLRDAQHCLIFGGHLGHQGGAADLTMLEKASAAKTINPDIEIAWDGGANEANVAQIVGAGIDVVNVGSAIQHSDNPEEAFNRLSHSA